MSEKDELPNDIALDVFLPPAPGQAELIANGDFDTSLTGWGAPTVVESPNPLETIFNRPHSTVAPPSEMTPPLSNPLFVVTICNRQQRTATLHYLHLDPVTCHRRWVRSLNDAFLFNNPESAKIQYDAIVKQATAALKLHVAGYDVQTYPHSLFQPFVARQEQDGKLVIGYHEVVLKRTAETYFN